MHLFDLCDGSWDTQSLLWIVPLSTVEGIRTLVSLKERGLIRFEKPSGG